MPKTDQLVTTQDIKAVAARIEQSYHVVAALHDLADQGLSWTGDSYDCSRTFVLMREALRSLARDLENCAEILQNDRGGFGYFEAHFGSV